MFRRRTLMTAAVVSALAFAGCAADDGLDEPFEAEPTEDPADPDDPTDEDDAVDDEPGSEADPSVDPDGIDDVASGLEDQVRAAVADLVERTGGSATDVAVVEAQRVDWPDGSLGCPEPDMMYTMALVEGYRIVLEADGDHYHYHGETGGDPFYCADPSDSAGSRLPTS